MHELIEYLDLKEINIIGHSMGAATIYNYVNQFGTSRLKSITAVDMSPYLRNHGWKGGIIIPNNIYTKIKNKNIINFFIK